MAIRYKPVSKPGRYGTLYLFELEYTDSADGGCPVFKTRKWAYDTDAVYLAWDDSLNSEGWTLLGVKRVNSDVPARRAS